MAGVIELIKSDLYRISGRNSGFFVILRYLIKPEFRYVFFFRLAHSSLNKGNGVLFFLFKILLRKYSIKYGYEIEPECVIGLGLRLVHRGGL